MLKGIHKSLYNDLQAQWQVPVLWTQLKRKLSIPCTQVTLRVRYCDICSHVVLLDGDYAFNLTMKTIPMRQFTLMVGYRDICSHVVLLDGDLGSNLTMKAIPYATIETNRHHDISGLIGWGLRFPI